MATVLEVFPCSKVYVPPESWDSGTAATNSLSDKTLACPEGVQSRGQCPGPDELGHPSPPVAPAKPELAEAPQVVIQRGPGARTGLGPYRRETIPAAGAHEKVAQLEDRATELGWTHDELWCTEGWYDRLGLVALLHAGETIGRVTGDFIEVLRNSEARGVRLRFYRRRQSVARSDGEDMKGNPQ